LKHLNELRWFLVIPAEAWFPNHVREDVSWIPDPIMPTMIFHERANITTLSVVGYISNVSAQDSTSE